MPLQLAAIKNINKYFKEMFTKDKDLPQAPESH